MSQPILNNYKPQPLPTTDLHKTTPPEEYDLNWAFEAKILRSDRVELRPFIPSLHAKILSDALTEDPKLSEYLPLRLTDEEGILTYVETVHRSNPQNLLYAIYSAPTNDDPHNPTPAEKYEFAGEIALTFALEKDMSIELGWIIILPKFQRTHVLTHTVGLSLHRTLDPISQGGLGLRRVQWVANSLNVKSQTAAMRLGFVFEGLLRGHRILEPGMKGAYAGRPGPKEDRMSRDTWSGSIIWGDWEGGGSEKIDKLMARR